MGSELSEKTVELKLRGSLSFNDMVRNYLTSYNNYSQRYKIVKGGISGNEPQDTFETFLKEFMWEKMIIIYQLQNKHNAKKMEDYIISCYPEIVPNWLGLSDIKNDGDNYIYFLVK